MNELNIGQQVELEYGDKATVTGVIGSGGQGAVYAVDYNGRKWALKWYDISKMKEPAQFRANIKRNITDGAPSGKFLWPQYLTKETADGTFGYLMDLKPDSFDAFTDILNTYKLKTRKVYQSEIHDNGGDKHIQRFQTAAQSGKKLSGSE